MNFHISPFSPLRPQFSSSATLAASRPPSSSGRRLHHDLANHDSAALGLHGSTPVRIAVESPDADRTGTNPNRGHHKHDDDDDDDSASNTTDESLSDLSVDDIAQDSRDVLVQRLNDLSDKLSTADVRASSIEALHRQVDDMERILRGAASRSRSASRHSVSSRRGSSSLNTNGPHRPNTLYLPSSGTGGLAESPRGRVMAPMSPISPSWFMSRFQQGHQAKSQEQSIDKAIEEEEELDEQHVKAQVAGRHASPSPLTANSKLQAALTLPITAPTSQRRPESVDASTSTSPPDIASDVAETVVKEAEKLCTEMATVIESLRARREESDHIHAILIEREQLAHQRLQQAAAVAAAQHQQQVAQIVAHHETELSHLRLDLRAIEAQCMAYVPADAHPELDASIHNWKDNWTRRRELCAARPNNEGVDEMKEFVAAANVPYILLTSP